MADIIKLLPDSVANQIAAGEVIQRPASVIKELVENAIDAGAQNITVILRDAGRTLIQIIDDGKGMSFTDARMAFERHATSKITSADDLFNIRTKGFRGEALASIAAVAQVELKTKRTEDELGTRLEISGSNVVKHELTGCSNGSSFSIKSLFYNVPARRKFLKTNPVEFRHIVNEFHRIALVAPEVSFKLIHNNDDIFDLTAGNYRQRIALLFGKALNARLVTVEADTSLVRISGFVGKPEAARKKSGEQFFFVNNRYMRHPYFHKAIMEAYGNILQTDAMPAYFIYLEVDPDTIDVNIHPTKTEIKFENEQAIWPILMAAVRESLGKFNLVPAIDFDQEGAIDIPVLTKDTEIRMPTIAIDPTFNPFRTTQKPASAPQPRPSKSIPSDWDTLYKDFTGTSAPKPEPEPPVSTGLFDEADTRVEGSENFYQFKGRYIVTSVKSGMMFIDQHRAHTRVLYEKFLANIEHRKVASQKLLFPETIELSTDRVTVLEDIRETVSFLGFDIERFGTTTFSINGVPPDTGGFSPVQLLHQLVDVAATGGKNIKDNKAELLAMASAQATAIRYGKKLTNDEMQFLVDSLFACSMPNYAPDGKAVLHILSENEIERLFR